MKHATTLGKWALCTCIGVIALGCSDGTDLPRCADGDQLNWSDSDGAWACGIQGVDSDADGLTDAEEDALGTNPEDPDTDGDTLEDGAEVELGTDPLLLDTDSDGLGDGFEQVFGSDPLLADTDADGLDDAGEYQYRTDPNDTDTDGDTFSDGIEVGDGPVPRSDPLQRFDWPLGIGWPDHRDAATNDGLIGGGWGVGQVAPNFTLDDQFGPPLDLYQFYGYIIYITVTAPWCPVELYDPAQADAKWQAVRNRGVIFIDVYSGSEFWKTYANNAGIRFPVLSDETWTVANAAGITAGVPDTILIDRGMRVRAVTGGAFPEALAALLAEEQCGNGTVDPGETCDDGNVDAWDGCSPTCEIETCRFEDDYGVFPQSWAVMLSPVPGIVAAVAGLPGEPFPRGALYVELRDGYGSFFGGDVAPGTYTLDGADLDPSTCGICINMFDVQYGSDWHTAVGGTVEVVSTSPNFEVKLNNITFQAILSLADNAPHPNGCTSAVEETTFSAPNP